MTAPNLPRVTPSATTPGGARAASRAGVSRVRVGRFGPRMLLRGAFLALALLVLVLLLTGCGNTELPAARTPAPATTPSPTALPTPSTTPTAPPSTTAAPRTDPRTTSGGPGAAGAPGPSGGARGPGADGGAGGSGGSAGSGGGNAPAVRAETPLWPAGDEATARRMQQQADSGGDPWLLDPKEVAISYVGAELGYRDPSLTRLGTARFAVTDGRSPAKATVELEQTVRTGPGGIWLVTRVESY